MLQTFAPRIARVVSISPEMAKEMLDLSDKTGFRNRNLSKRIVARYADAMAKNEWGLSNDAIAVTSDGKVLNGQHRLHAVISSGTTQKFLVLEDADEMMFKYLDNGTLRTMNDYVVSSGLESTPAMANAAYYIINMFDRNELFTHIHKSLATYGYKDRVRFLVDKHYDLFLAAREQQKQQARGSLIPTKAFMVCNVLFSFADKKNAQNFFRTLHTKEWGSERVFITLYNTFLRMPKNLNSEFRNVQVMKLLFAAWNAYRSCQSPMRLRTNSDNTLPEIIGFNRAEFFKGIPAE